MEPVVEVKPVAVKKSTAARMLDCGQTKIRDLILSGELETINVGSDSRVVVASINRFVQKQLAGPR